MSFFLKHMANNLWQGRFSIFPEDAVTHAVSARLGGVSKVPYDSLNLALHVGDSSEDVCRNRDIFAGSLHLRSRDITTPEQVHGDFVFRVTEKDRGRGSRAYDDSIPRTDALITNVKGCFALRTVYPCCFLILKIWRWALLMPGGREPC